MHRRFLARWPDHLSLVSASILAISLPVAVGVVTAPSVRAQSSASERRLVFDAASVKPISLPTGVSLMEDGKVGVSKGSGIQIPPNTGGPGTDDPGRIHWPLITLKELLRRAWDSYYEINGPGCRYVTSAHELAYHDYSTGFRCCAAPRQ